jgi:excisionase family DNA binding protein
MALELLTAADVSDRLRVPQSWVYRAARNGELPSVQCGRYRRFLEDDVERWIRARRTGIDDPRVLATLGRG